MVKKWLMRTLKCGAGERTSGGGAMADLERVYYREFTITLKRSGQGWTAVPHRPADYTTLDVAYSDERDNAIAYAKSLVDEHFEKVRRAMKR